LDRHANKEDMDGIMFLIRANKERVGADSSKGRRRRRRRRR
jgi:hypothetical protein